MIRNNFSWLSAYERLVIVGGLGRIGDLDGGMIVGLDIKDRLLTHND
jgi:hypothetical protein